MSNPQRKVIHSEARNIISNVIAFFDKQKTEGKWTYSLEQATELAMAATGISRNTILRIRKELKEAEGVLLKSPRKKRKSDAANKITLDDFEQGVLRRSVHEVYTVDKVVPTIRLLQEKMKEKLGYTGSREHLRKYLKNLGFSYKKCHDKRKLLMERNDIVAWRSRYLRRIRENDALGDNKRPVTYLDETYIHPSYSIGKCWQSEEEPGSYRSERAGQRHIIVHAGGSYGFVNNGLLIFKSQTKSGDYHDEMNHGNFMKWLETQIIPNLPANGIVVMDNAPYHNVQINKAPTQASRKNDIRIWLENNKIPTTADMRKAELLSLAKKFSPNKTFYADELLKEHGHTVIRLPPYHCELNPIEMIWATMKRKVAMRNVSSSSSSSSSSVNIEELVRNSFSEIMTDNWKNHCEHVRKIQDEMWERDGLMDDIVENLQFMVNTGSSDDDDSDENYSDLCSDSDSN